MSEELDKVEKEESPSWAKNLMSSVEKLTEALTKKSEEQQEKEQPIEVPLPPTPQPQPQEVQTEEVEQISEEQPKSESPFRKLMNYLF